MSVEGASYDDILPADGQTLSDLDQATLDTTDRRRNIDYLKKLAIRR